MKISFVVPAYNEENYLGACLDSIRRELAAGKHEAEIIVVNNASTDRTRDIASAVPGVIVVDEPRKGLVRARQAGFLASSGDLIANVDADARLTPGWIDTVVAEFDRDPDLAALSGPLVYFDMPNYGMVLVRIFYRAGFAINLVIQRVFKVGAMLQGGNFVLRRSVLEAIGGFDTSIDFYGEDTDIARRAARQGRVKWTFALPIYSSARRLMGEGIVRVGTRYALNYFWVNLCGRPLTKTSTDVRPEQPEPGVGP